MAHQSTHTRASLDRLRERGARYLVVARRDGPDGRGGTLLAGACHGHYARFWPARMAHPCNLYAVEHIDHVRGTDE